MFAVAVSLSRQRCLACDPHSECSVEARGRTVVIAARISALALGGEILASGLVYALARGLGTFTFGDSRTSTLKGLDGSFDLHPVLG